MSKENHTNNGKKIKRVRLLLDDPFNADFEDIDDKYLSALHKRLTSSSTFRKPLVTSVSKEPSDLTPRVVIHKKEQKTQHSLSSKEHTVKHLVYRVDIPQEELFEIERLFDDIPEFFEVKATKSIQKESDEKSQFIIVEEEMKRDEENKIEDIEHLPKWESVSDEEVEQDITIDQPYEPIIEESIKEEKEEITFKEIEKKEEGEIVKEPTLRQDAFKPVKETEKTIKKSVKKPLSITHDSFDEADVWESIDEEKQQITLKEKARIFKIFAPIKQINQETALILYQHGITSIGDLYSLNPEQLVRIDKIPSSLIEHVKRKQKKSEVSPTKFEVIERETEDGRQQKSKDEFQYNNYALYKKEITIGEDKKRTVHFFSKDPPEDGNPASLPEGYEVKVNRKTGVPYIKKIKK